MQAAQKRCWFLRQQRQFALLLVCVIFFQSRHLQAFSNPEEFNPILINVGVSNLGSTEIPALISKQTLYLSVTDLFRYLKIKTEVRPGGVIEGFVLHQLDSYSINQSDNSITYKGNVYPLEPGSLQVFDDVMYLQASVFGRIFDLVCEFDFRNLHVKLQANPELPIFKELRREQMWKYLGKGPVFQPDTVLTPQYKLIDFEGFDWSLTLNKGVKLYPEEELKSYNQGKIQSRGFVNIGGELGYGNFIARINWFGNSKFNYRNIDFRWKRILTSQNVLRQITIGRINSTSFATRFQPITGVGLTNAPPVARKSFGFHTIRDFTRPFWVVELYLNNELIEYTKTDETGLYHFEIPLNYGTNKLQLKLYGPSGEQEIRDETVFVPFLLLPKKELIYHFNAGIVHSLAFDKLVNAQISYGLTEFFTLGGGLEYFSGSSDRKFISKFTTTTKVGNNMLLSTEWLPEVKASGVLNARTKSGIVVDLSYEAFEKGQKTFPQINYLSLSRITGMIPFRIRGTLFNSRINFTELSYPKSKSQTVNWSLNGTILGAFSNLTTQVSRFQNTTFMTSMIQQSHRLPADWLLNTRAQVNYRRMDFSNLMVGLEKHLQSGLRLKTFYQIGFNLKNSVVGLSLRYDFGFFQSITNSRLQGDQLMINQSMMGSVVQDEINRNLNFSSRSEMGRASLTIMPFLDINNNQVKDKEELYEFELSAKVKGSSSLKDPKTGVTRVKNLIPYQEYLIELDENSLPEISWRLDLKKIELPIKPGNSNELLVPIKVVNEVEGKVMMNNKPIGGIKIQFFNQENKLIKEVVSQQDGSFYNSNLLAGTYTFKPDFDQLSQLEMDSETEGIRVQFEESMKGEYSDGWVIQLSKKEVL